MKRVVIKLGTSTVVNAETNTLAISRISRVVEVVVKLRELGYQVIIVSSGAIGCGSIRLGIKKKPKQVGKKQALAALGQIRLMSFYDSLFQAVGIVCAQILLTYANLDDRAQYDNAQKCLEELFRYGCVPIINENDTTATQEIRIGDNDTLSAFVANMTSAEWLFLVTDVDGLHDKNPSEEGAKRIPKVRSFSNINADIGGSGTSFGTGGMTTKIKAAKLSVACGVRVVILSSKNVENIPAIINGSEDYGTQFLPQTTRIVKHRKRWILAIRPVGKIYIDQGALKAIEKKRGLLPVGVVGVEGSFGFRDIVGIYLTDNDVELGKGMVNFDSGVCTKLLKTPSDQIPKILGYSPWSCYMISRENISLFDQKFSSVEDEAASKVQD